MRIVVINHVTLDGVMQSPGRSDEDTRDGFTHGGWAAARGGDVQQAWGERLSHSSGFLLGRRTYEDVLGYWNTQDSPFKAALNQAPKYVASSRAGTTLEWPNSHATRRRRPGRRRRPQGHPWRRPPHHGQWDPHPLAQRRGA